MFVVLNSGVREAVAGGVNCIDHHRSGDLPRFPAVLSGQEALQEENLGSQEGCERPPGPPVTSSWSEAILTLQWNGGGRKPGRKYFTFQDMNNVL